MLLLRNVNDNRAKEYEYSNHHTIEKYLIRALSSPDGSSVFAIRQHCIVYRPLSVNEATLNLT